MVFGATGARAAEAQASARSFLAEAGESRVDVHDLRDGFFPAAFATIKELFEALKDEENPDLILTHTRADHHQDHRPLAELTWNTFRDHMVLGYEIPKYDPDLGNPELFVPLDGRDRRAQGGDADGAFRDPAAAALVRAGDVPWA